MKKIIWMYWGQGWNKAPRIPRICSETWQYHNKDWLIVKLDNKTLGQYVNLNLLKNNKDLTGMSDIIRIDLMKNHGGVWVDSTTFCTKPLDEWLPGGTFLFNRPDPRRMVASWFIKYENTGCIIDLWHKEVINYWKNRNKSHTYFWFHSLFNQCYRKYPDFKLEWDKQVKIECLTTRQKSIGPHSFCPYGKTYSNPMTPKLRHRYENKLDPLYKLTWKTQIKQNSAVDYILKDFKNKYMK